MTTRHLAQEGVLSDPTPFVEYLTLVLRDGSSDQRAYVDALDAVAVIKKSIGQKDTTAGLSITAGFSRQGWLAFFPGRDLPADLREFGELRQDGRHFPSTPGDLFFMIKSSRLDLNFQAAKYLVQRMSEVADVGDDTQGFRYLDDRDLIDFVDGTENPAGLAREQAVVLGDGSDYPGGSYVVVQRYVDRQDRWDALPTSEQEEVIGRTKFDDIELADDKKKPFAHNVRSKVTRDGVEMHMLRQNRAWGTAVRHGTMFVGFAADLSVIEESLRRMIIADDDGAYDHLLDFVVCETGTTYFVPPAELVGLD